jgi:hypothetical protein
MTPTPEAMERDFDGCKECGGSGVVPERHGPGLTEMLACDDCEGTGLAPQPSVPSGEAVAWAPQLVDGSMPLLVYASVDFRTVEQAVEHFIKPEHWRVIPLYAAPPQERVSEAMVERAVATRVFNSEADREVWRTLIREALTAALAPSRRAPSGDGGGRDA